MPDLSRALVEGLQMKTNYPVHPLAAVFPMMTDDEIDDLAADIKTNGLIHAITLDKDGELLVDGRNRLKACKSAGVEPRFERLNGQDPEAFILSTNIARRHMMKGAIAMVVAKAYPDEAAGGRGKKSVATTRFPMVSTSKLAHARTVLQFAPDLVDGVLAGRDSLDAAYRIAVERKQAADSVEAKMARLRKAAPDLADLVTEERMKLDEAIAAQAERERQTRMIIDQGRRAAEGGMSDFLANVAAIAAAFQAGATDLLDRKRLRDVLKAAESLNELLK